MQKTLSKVLLALVLTFGGCGKKSADEAVRLVNVATTDKAAKPDEKADVGSGAAVMAGSGSAQGDTNGFHDYGVNPWVDATKDHLSTFAADVDTASYTLARRMLNEGHLPVAAGVRVEEFVNYFRYKFPEPTPGTPFAVVMDAAPSPLSPGRHILRVGVGTKAKSISERKPEHLVFLVDVSGLDEHRRIGSSSRRRHRCASSTNNLGDNDTVAIVT